MRAEDAVRGASALEKRQMKAGRKGWLWYFTGYNWMCKEVKDAVTQQTAVLC